MKTCSPALDGSSFHLHKSLIRLLFDRYDSQTWQDYYLLGALSEDGHKIIFFKSSLDWLIGLTMVNLNYKKRGTAKAVTETRMLNREFDRKYALI